MKLSKSQLNKIVENYLLEQDSIDAAIEDSDEEETNSQDKEESSDKTKEEKPETPDTIEFKVSTDDGDRNISLRRQNDKPNHKIYVDDRATLNIGPTMDLQVLAAHGYIHPDTTEETKSILQKILNRDPLFKGKSENGILGLINDKMSTRLGVQGYNKTNLSDILNKG